ncbi:hypothetical protein [Sodalis ligni]|uniref:hypothetical protein n=1 Tax=Sodalis ligni TaxID=2697027 RepID=UPI00209806A2|nr:hypothetical protein [Sodalis ligni]
MSDWIYPEVINHLKKSCKDFLDEKITIQDIQEEIFSAENQVVALEEKWLHTIFLMRKIRLNYYVMLLMKIYWWMQ